MVASMRVPPVERQDANEGSEDNSVRGVPVCAIWNMLDNRSEEQVPLMTITEWLSFIQGHSQINQERMRLIMSSTGKVGDRKSQK